MARAVGVACALVVTGIVTSGCDTVHESNHACRPAGSRVTMTHDTPIATHGAGGHLTDVLEFNNGFWFEEPTAQPAGRPTLMHGYVRLTGRDTAIFVPDHGIPITLRHRLVGCG